MKPDRIIKRKIPVTDAQHQTYTVMNASVCTEKKQTLIKMIVHACSWCSRKFVLVNHDSKFSAFFFCSVFPTILGPNKGLFLPLTQTSLSRWRCARKGRQEGDKRRDWTYPMVPSSSSPVAPYYLAKKGSAWRGGRAYLYLKEFWVSYGTGNILPTLFPKPLVHLTRRFPLSSMP